MWKIKDKGFLPENDPVASTKRDFAVVNPDTDLAMTWEPIDAFFTSMDVFMESVPQLIEDRRFREEVVSFLRSYPYDIQDYSTECLERLFKNYCYMASAYVHALHETTATRLPKEIAIPLKELAKRLDREPILSYSCYALNNWRRKDPSKPIVLENIELQQNFSKNHKTDEDWFILIHVDIEARAADGISAIKEYRDSYLKDSPPTLIEHCDRMKYEGRLRRMHSSLRMMNVTMSRMPENCSDNFYFKAVRPFIFGFDKVTYEGIFQSGDPVLTLRGETGAQSSIVPAFVAALKVEHTDSILTTHLKDMRKYMPREHREFLRDVESINAAGQVGTFREMAKTHDGCKGLYNSCLEELLKFRTLHLQFAIDYIQKKVDDPTGTGGTPFIPWLTQLKDETEARYIK
jgi:indoleamine 2,3-dioxygenase